MTSVNVRMSAETLFDTYGVYAFNRLGADPAAAMIKSGFEVHQTHLISANQDWLESVREELRARAQRDWEERSMRNSLRSFSNRTIEAGGGSRNTPIHRIYFPNGFTHASTGSLEELIREGESIAVRLESETDPSVLAGGEELRQAIESARTVQSTWAEAKRQVRVKRDTLEAAKIAWIGGYRRVAGELTALHPHDRQLVSSFFYRKRRKTSIPELDSGVGEDGIGSVESGAWVEGNGNATANGNGNGNGNGNATATGNVNGSATDNGMANGNGNGSATGNGMANGNGNGNGNGSAAAGPGTQAGDTGSGFGDGTVAPGPNVNSAGEVDSARVLGSAGSEIAPQ